MGTKHTRTHVMKLNFIILLPDHKRSSGSIQVGCVGDDGRKAELPTHPSKSRPAVVVVRPVSQTE